MTATDVVFDPVGAPMARSLIDISVLDEKIQEKVARYGNLKDFHIVLWRQEPDVTGSNWNARIERLSGDADRYPNWWDIVPALREIFNLR